ncbi:MAG TPA: branched-chain amino acid ABC transporter permease [Acetobacteraceae bacterium]|nr:branched-chain amino acid ABC transporter permease [Acetobacteraceae bacterium]
MSGLAHQIISGLASGSIYAAVALALVMIYQSTHHINFAQGEMATLSTYICLTLINAGVPYWGAFVVTVIVSFIMGAVVERILIRPTYNAPILTSVGVFIGLLLLINAMDGWIFDYIIKPFPSPFGGGQPLFGGYVSAHEVGETGVTLVVLLMVFLFFRYTTLGLAMRAAAFNATSSRLCGVRVNRMLMLGWALAAAIGAVAGIMVAPIVFLDPNMMFGILTYAFAGALVGGVDNPWGAVVGGFIVGVLENLFGAYVVGTELKLTVALLIIVAVLLVKPAGLFGRPVQSRV